MKILIVEDNREMREMLGFWLSDLADEIRECADGAEALDAYKSFLPDWVLMDWEMKQMDGLTATREIVAVFPNAKIVIVTIHNEAALRNAANAAGARGYVLKDDLTGLRGFFDRDGA